jgi:hypothetical protein
MSDLHLTTLATDPATVTAAAGFPLRRLVELHDMAQAQVRRWAAAAATFAPGAEVAERGAIRTALTLTAAMAERATAHGQRQLGTDLVAAVTERANILAGTNGANPARLAAVDATIERLLV